MKMLFVAKDMGGANVTRPLAQIGRRQGHEVLVVTEGLASGIYEKAGFEPYFKGTVNFKAEPFDIDVSAILKKIGPDVLVAGQGSPINLEERFGLAANQAGIPLVECNDFWNGTKKSSAYPTIVLALDEFDERLSRARHPKAKVHIVGNPGVLKPGSIKPSSEVLELRKKCDAVYTYVGGGNRSEDEIKFLLACLEMTSGDWRLIPRFHPKHANLLIGAGPRTFGDLWTEMLAPLGKRVIYVPELKFSDTVVVASDATFSSWSTLLTTSACYGKVTASLLVPSAREELKQLTDLDQVPIVELGCAHCLTEPIDLTKLAPPSAENVAKLKPYDADVAYASVVAQFRHF